MMKKNILVLIAVVGISLIPSHFVFAAEGYGSAGCGLGSIIFGNEPGIVQVSAATTNGSSYSQLLGITSGTSNCDKQPDSFSHLRLNEFVASNMDNLAKEIAVGAGESLDTLAELMRIPKENRAAVYSKLQGRFDNIFASEEVEAPEVIDRIMTIVRG